MKSKFNVGDLVIVSRFSYPSVTQYDYSINQEWVIKKVINSTSSGFLYHLHEEKCAVWESELELSKISKSKLWNILK